jgi:NADPH-dependent glutamate synthase beta subunit-like oxidoreductase
LGGEIPVWLQQVREGQYYEAWLTLTANNPFPAVTGRVCHHPCESNCNRDEYDESVTINALEQYVGDLALQEGWALPAPASGNGIRVAVIGSGPAGLSCAYQLRIRGFEVHVFEAQSEPGGVLRYGIPDYRLPKEIVAREIGRLLALGIKLQTNTMINKEILAQLASEYAAVCLAIGAPKSKILPQFPAGDARVLNGLHFLLHMQQGNIPSLGSQVVVIGGGSVAMDVARTARRLGKQVQVLALEDKAALPAQAEEVREALEEGIEILDGVMVKETAEDINRLILNCVKVVLDPEAPAGVIKPIVVPETGFQVVADTVILAVGQDPDLDSFAPSLPIKNNLVEVDGSQCVGQERLFACGDVTSSVRYVSGAIGAGKQAARGMEAFCAYRQANDNGGGVPLESVQPVSFNEVNTFYFPAAPRKEREMVAPELRVQNFGEVKLALGKEDVLAQAERCFSCGHCLKCDNCFYYCPDMAIIKHAEPEQSYSIIDQYCKGCGLCVEECPRGALVLREVKL